MQCLTEEMRSDWVEKGYIHLKGVLDSDEVAGYLAAADAVSPTIAQLTPRRGSKTRSLIGPDGAPGAYYEPQDQRDIILAGIADPT